MRTSTKVASSVATALLLASAASWGHARLTTPPPRDVNVAGNDAHKAGPCGGVAKGQPGMKYAADAGTVNIKWEETIDHTGCFVLDVSASGNDGDFKVLKVVKDQAAIGPKMTNIALDGGLTCANCTFRLRQIMGADPATCNGATVTAAGTYYSCADIQIGDFADSGAIPTDDGGPGKGDDAGTGTEQDAGTTVPGTDGGHTGGGVDAGAFGDNTDDTLPTSSGSGCSTSPGPVSGLAGFAALSAVAALAFARAKKKQKKG